MRRLFVTGIGTDIGKTVVSAVLSEALEADYWKPIQCGELENTDSMRVQSWISNKKTVIHQEAYRLNGFMSPHAAAKLDNVEIELKAIVLPDTSNDIIIEGAGGLMVPLNNHQLVIDLIAHLEAETIVVSHNYLGSINHTLLTLEVLENRGIQIAGIIFNGEENPDTESVILESTGVKQLGRIGWEDSIDSEVVSKYAEQFTTI
ncbi:TPA: dethiobiotin synthase [Candidatus Poribacteria bacterium]|nr:dethiobiotin synthase [Candidatus Poribacteria bacterium]